MFFDDLFTGVSKSVENAIDILNDLADGEIDKKKIAKLIADGVEIAVIAKTLGVGEEVIKNILEEIKND